MKKILVTGGHGFLGRAVVRELRVRGYRDVLSPGHDELDLLSVPQVSGYFLAEQPDTVIHCAGRVGGISANVAKPADFMHDNLLMGLNVLKACARYEVEKLCIIGTSCSYPAGASCPINESEMFTGLPAKATGHYGVAKSTLFMAADAYRKQYKLKSILLVPTNLYGPWDKSSHVVPDLVRKFCRQPKAVEIWGTGRATRDFLYITDAAQGIVTACENPGLPTVPINLGSGVETPISELADRIRRLSGSEAEIVWAHSEPEGQLRRVLDIERAKNWLGWNPPTLLEDGLRATIHAFKHS